MTTSKKKSRSELEKMLTKAFRSYGKGMNSYAFFKISNHAIGEELVQDTFTKTWKHLIKGGKINLMKPFLYHVLDHLIIDEYRKNETSSLDFLLKKGFEPSLDSSNSISDILDGKEVMRLIQRLPPKYKKVIRMRYVLNLSIKEVADITGQSKNVVAVQSHRGLAKLKKLHNHP